VGKIAEKAVCRSVFCVKYNMALYYECRINKNSLLVFLPIFPTGTFEIEINEIHAFNPFSPREGKFFGKVDTKYSCLAQRDIALE